MSDYDLYSTICAYIDDDKKTINKQENERRIKIRYALVYFGAKQFDDLQLKQDAFITIKPWSQKLYAATDKKNHLCGRIRAILGCDNIIKHPDPQKTIAHFNKYPKCMLTMLTFDHQIT